MTNLNEMTSKQLKELGKQHHVKDWWNLSKAALISALSEIDSKQNDRKVEHETVESTIKKPSLKIRELTYNGKTQTIKKWATELEMPWPTLYDRVNRCGWTVEEALSIPLGGRRKK